MTTYSDAVNEMFTLFTAAWDANTVAIVGSVPAVYYQGVEQPGRPSRNIYWARASIQSIIEQQTSHKIGIAPDQNRRYTATGLFILQLFCPMSDFSSIVKGRQLAEVARNAFRGKTTAGNVWFRNARINELPPDNDNYRFNIIVEYEYDDIG